MDDQALSPETLTLRRIGRGAAVEGAWQEFRTTVLVEDATPVQIEDLKVAFYTGVRQGVEMLSLILTRRADLVAERRELMLNEIGGYLDGILAQVGYVKKEGNG
jgi:hypothetical protein